MSGAAQLLGSGQAGRTRTYDGHFFPGPNLGGVRPNPAFVESTLHDVFLNLLDGDWRLINPQYAGRFARRGTDSSGEFGEVIGGVQLANRIFPMPAINQVVP